MTNPDIARLLRSIAAAYTLKGENFFKIQAYDKAASAIEHSTSEIKDLWEAGKLDSIPGVGSHIGKYLDELFKKGKVEHFEKIMSQFPSGLFEILFIPGIGPKTALKIVTKLEIKTLADLENAVRKGKISKIPTLGEKTQEEILKGIAEYKRRPSRMLLSQAWILAQEIIDTLKKCPEVIDIYPLGSLRRMVSTVGDIDFAVSSKKPEKVVDCFLDLPQIARVLSKGKLKGSAVLKNSRQVDLMVSTPDRFGALLQHFTGSKLHNIHLRKIANKKKLSLSEYGISKFHPKGEEFATDFLLKCKTEEEFYTRLGMQYIEPELREDRGEIEAATKKEIPKLVELSDIRGDIHLHTNFQIDTSHDLGSNTALDLLKKAKKLGYDYIGFSDHNPSIKDNTLKSIKALIERRNKHIEQLKSSDINIRVLNLLEVDIMANGSLALSDEVLQMLDGVLAGIHSSFRKSKKETTDRLLGAIKHPLIQVIVHPTGRLLQEREEYEVDWEKIFIACKDHKKILEINSWPQRLDFPDNLVREAVREGIRLVINTDAHTTEHMDNMRFGVSVARRGWVKKEDVINTLPWVEFKKYFMIK